MLSVQVGNTQVDDDLYREIILDHYRNPRRRGAVDPADGTWRPRTRSAVTRST